jgi:parallel beta-helix repeat protein/predicted outer membrane repeat protein
MIGARTLGAMFIASTSVAAIAHAADIAVPGDAPTIQAAIALAQDGDRVLVAPGVYAERIDFLGKAIVVEGAAGASKTIIDGQGDAGFVVRFASGETRDSVLRGVTVRGGVGTPSGSAGGGILVSFASPTIEESVVTENVGIFGGGIAVIGGSPILRDLSIIANHALAGGGVSVEMASIEIESSAFESNTAINFGGGLSLLGGSAVLRDLRFEGNGASSLGGAIATNAASLDARGIDVLDNGSATVFDGGQIFSTFGGGGIYATATTGRIDGARFVGNVAYAGSGVYVASGDGLEIVNALIAQNDGPLGAVYANSASPTLLNCTIADNDGFGLYTTFSSFPIVRNSILAGNTSVASTEIAGNGITTIASSLIDGSAFAVAFGGGVLFASAQLDPSADYAPLPGSPAIDAGDNADVPADVTTDLLGNARFFDDPKSADTGAGTGPIVDFGAIEFGSTPLGPQAAVGDMNADGTVGAADLAMLLANWGPCGGCAADLDGDGAVGAADLAILLAHWSA